MAKKKKAAGKKKVAKKIMKKTAKKGMPKKAAAPARKKAAAPAQPAPPVGSFVWHELMTTDTARARDFYTKLFGWKSAKTEMMPGFIYTVFSNKGQDIAGMMQITPDHGVASPRWDIYVSVRSVDATAQRCEELGGEILVPPHDIPVGRWAGLKDPTGASIAIYKSSMR